MYASIEHSCTLSFGRPLSCKTLQVTVISINEIQIGSEFPVAVPLQSLS